MFAGFAPLWAQPVPEIVPEATPFSFLNTDPKDRSTLYGVAAALADLPATASGGGFGAALALVGAPGADIGADPQGSSVGAAVVYRRSTAGMWAEEAIFVPEDAETRSISLARYGEALALVAFPDGRVVALVGAPKHPAPGARRDDDHGAVYAYERAAATGAWSPAGRLDGPFLNESDRFGASLAARALPDGRVRAVVGSFGRSTDGVPTGAAFVVEQTTTEPPPGEPRAWEVRAELSPPIPDDPQGGFERTGDGVALLEYLALVGAYSADRNGVESVGAAYSYARDAQTGIWAREGELLAPTPSKRGQFGHSVALAEVSSLTVAFVGEPGDGTGGSVHGYVRRETEAGGEWEHAAELQPETLSHRGSFGWWTAAASRPDGSVLVVATSRASRIGGGFATGSATAFTVRADGSGGLAWEEEALLRSSEPQEVEYLGGSTSGHGLGVSPAGFAIIGSPGFSRGEGKPWGRSYAFDLRPVLPVVAQHPPPSGSARLDVWPNPSRAAAAHVRLAMPAGETARVVVVDALGREVAVLHEGPVVGEASWSLPALAPGVYGVRAVGPWGAAVARATVVR